MTTSKFNHFRNEIIALLSQKLDASSLGIVLASIDLLSDKYDVVNKETALIQADDLLKQYAVLYLCCARQEGKSGATVDDYGRIIGKFCNAMQGKSLEDIKTMDVRRYLLSYQQNSNATNLTTEHVRVVICGFFQWMQDNEYINGNPCKQIKKIKYEKKTRQSVTGEDIARLRHACNDDREKVIIEVLIGSGLRVSELANLKLSAIDFRENSMDILGKGNKHRKVYLTPEALVAIERYVGNLNTDRYLIVKNNVTKTGVSARTIERVVSEIYNRANVSSDKKITPHVLRHTFATSLVKHGCPITSVKTLLGHSSINTTMIYTHLDDASVHHDFMVHNAM